ncbi:MAG: response regulator [Proteobacteria bacterium]|nr:MAG: response regulator [Pseudomonadota bacterium]
MTSPSSRSKLASEPVNDRLIDEISKLVNSLTGIQLGEKQRSMVSSRVKKRMSTLGLHTDADYSAHLRAHAETETAYLVSLLTTHHTYFFREFAHFEHLEKTALPGLIKEKKKVGSKKITVWSAACSTGQEVYSLAMFLDYYFSKHAPDFTYEILGTDVDPASVKAAANGVFRAKEIKEVPLQFLGRHWAKGTGDIADFVKVKSTLKARCQFEAMNLLKPSGRGISQKFDLIFCRNVFIYFNTEQIKSITKTLLASLADSGALYLGVSESLNGLGLPCEIVGPSIYSHPKKSSGEKPQSTAPVAPLAMHQALRVFCVDDSPTILALLKKILTTDLGFEIVGTATNGLEAAQKLKTLKVDLMTLDIHMPEQTGLEYLKNSYKPGHPPVVMITSVSREDASLPMECLRAGAFDYVEKPSLANLATQADEIRMKLKLAAKSKHSSKGHDLVSAFSKQSGAVLNISSKLRVIFCSEEDRAKALKLVTELGDHGPATSVVTNTSEAQDFFSRRAWVGKSLSVIVFGDVAPELAKSIAQLNPDQLILEDRSQRTRNPELRVLATEIIPATSFAYTSSEFFKRGAA